MEKEGTFTFKYFLNLIFRRLNLLIILFSFFFILFLIYNFRKPYTPIYKATFEIGISRERISEEFFGERSIYSPFYQVSGSIQRIISYIMDTDLLKKIVDSLSLYSKIEGVNNIKIECKIKKEYNKNLGPFFINFIDEESFEIKENDGRLIGIGKVGEYFDLGDVEFKIYKNNTKYKNFKITFYSPNKVALALRNSINIKVLEIRKLEKEISSGIPYSGEAVSKNLVIAGELSPSANLLGITRVSLFWGNPDDALRIAKCLSQFILKYDILEKSKKYVQSRKFIESQLSLYSSKLDSVEREIRNFKEKNKIANLEAKTQNLISRISELESKKEEIEIKEKILSDFKERVSKKEIISDTISDYLFVILQDPVLERYYTNLIDLETEYKAYKKEYSIEHPKLREILAKLSALQEGIKNEISKRMESIKSEKKGIESKLKALHEKLEEVPKEEIFLAKLEREKERMEKLFSFFAEKLEETRIQEAGITSEFRIINPPITSYIPVNKRNVSLIIIFSFFFSIFFSFLIVFILEYFDPRIKDIDILKNKAPLYGIIPFKKIKNNLEIFKDKSSYLYESFKKLSLNISFAHPEKKYKLIYITSGIPEEGKTFVTSSLGIVLSDSDKKVLIIDCDFRKKKEHLIHIFNIKEDKGIFEYLRGEVSLSQIINKINENLYIIGSGNVPLNIGIYLESKKFENFLNEVKKDFDYVLIDSAPILLFSDSMYIAPKVDGVIIVARYSLTRLDTLEESINTIKNSGGNLIGIVFNSVPFKKAGYYYYPYYKYYSKYYKT